MKSLLFIRFIQWNDLYHIKICYDESALISSYSKYMFSDGQWNNNEKFAYDYSIASSVEPLTENKTASIQSYPNPFSNENTVVLNIDEPSMVSVKVTDSKGNEITELVNSFLNQGIYSYSLSNLNLAQGTYYISLNTGKKVEVLQVVSIK